MKKIFFIVMLLLAINTFGQKLTGNIEGLQTSLKKEKRSLTMFYDNLSNESLNTIIYIDGKQVSLIELLCINSKNIDTYSVDKKTITINGKEYKEQLSIKTKNNYKPRHISLKEIRKKYATEQILPCVYFIDGKLARVDDVEIFLDANNILEICCRLFNADENLKLNIIEIFTRSDKNIEEANTMIRR